MVGKTYKGVLCKTHLPYTSWVGEKTGVVPPVRTAKISGDSTLEHFRRICCSHIRLHGYDVRCWSSKGGASEADVAFHVASSGVVDLTFVLPNGNQLARHKNANNCKWIQQVCANLCGALQTTSTLAVAFVGNSDLCPGVKWPPVFSVLVPQFQQGLRDLRIPVLSQVENLVLLDDLVHWSRASRPCVLQLLDDAVKSATSCQDFAVMPTPILWRWKYHPDSSKHFPNCIACDKLPTRQHLEGRVHRECCGGTLASFDFGRREELCTNGIILYREDGTQNKDEFVAATEWLASELPDRVPVLLREVPYADTSGNRSGIFRGVAGVIGNVVDRMPNCYLPRSIIAAIFFFDFDLNGFSNNK